MEAAQSRAHRSLDNRLVVPPVEFQMQVLLNEHNKQVFDVEVHKEHFSPSGVDPGNRQYYVRRNATTFPAPTDEVRHLAQSRLQVGQLGTGSPLL